MNTAMNTTSTSDQSSGLQVQVQQAYMLNPLIRQLRMSAPDGGTLPGFSAGAHIKVRVQLPDGRSDERHYSLIELDHAACASPTEYCIAVRREDAGRGGSCWMHEAVQVGDVLQVSVPRNDFALQAPENGCTVLVAGGIGVTPLMSMAAQCRAEGRPVRMHYAGRSRALMAFLPELAALLGDDLQVHVDEEVGAPPDVAALMDRCTDKDYLHVCGPQVMLDAILAEATQRGWAPDRVRFELFAAPQAQDGDAAFEVVLASSGQRLTVGPTQTLLDVLEEAGCDPMFDCRRGECGVCAVPVISGEIDHRDHVLTPREKEAGNVIQTCVSRCKGTSLVLDL